ncbi:MAG: hypothetical protein K2H84_09490 [Paramuribaculum sp.]|nr:hypothetical protein [Paramuribaculum sp.]
MKYIIFEIEMGSQPNILLLGDYSNCHRTLATGLRALGCTVTIASDGSRWMNTQRDIDLSRSGGKLGGAGLLLRSSIGNLSRQMRGYDIVAIHDLNFLTLRPLWLRPLFRKLKKNSGSLFLSAMSTDIAYLDMVTPPHSPLRYSEWFVGDTPSRHHIANADKWKQWHSKQLVSYQREVLEALDGAVSVLYEYHLGMMRALGEDRCAYGGIPIDTQLFSQVSLPENPEKVKFFLGRDRTRKLMKGSDLLEIAARSVVEEMPHAAELKIVENLPFDSFVGELRNAHVVLDQIYSYTPATTALMAMSLGIPTVSGGEPEYYDFIGEKENRPIFNAPLHLPDLTDTLRSIVLNKTEIARRGAASREFVLKHNSAEVVAKRFLDFWLSKL